MVLTLRPPITLVGVGFNKGQAFGATMDSLSEDLAGCVLSLDGYDDMYYITNAPSGNTGLNLSRPFSLDTGNYNVTIYRLEYDNSGRDTDGVVPSIVLATEESKTYSYSLTENGSLKGTFGFGGSYSPTQAAVALETALNSQGSLNYVVSYDTNTGLFSITTETPGTFILDFSYSVAGQKNYMGPLFGFRADSYTLQVVTNESISSEYRVNGILRITRPMTHYRESNVYSQSAKDAGKIFMIDNNTFTREFPLSRLVGGVPTRFCITQAPDGYCKFKFNSFVDELVPVEVNYIPIQQNLVDSTTDIPLVPTPYTKFLIYGASYFLLLEKSDTKAQQYFSMAQMQLKAMVNDNRKGLSLGGQNFGRIVPRAPNRNRYYSVR